jgi:alpha-beta hydrolase superfamily lysophospholipase
VAAPDLPHHGELRRRGARFASLKDYVEAVDEVATELGRPLILAGHSMGGFIVQKYLESKPADLGVMLASIPPTGGSSFGRRLMRRHPRSFVKTLFTLRAADSVRMTPRDAVHDRDA